MPWIRSSRTANAPVRFILPSNPWLPTKRENNKKDHTMVIMISIIGGLLLIALIVIVVLNSISKSSNSNNSSCSGDTCPLGIKVVFDYFKSIL